MPRPEGESCGTCRYWSPPTEDQGKMGRCRRLPLQVNKVPQGESNGNAEFPRIKDFGWCGEWKTVVTEELVNQLAEWTGNTNAQTIERIREILNESRQTAGLNRPHYEKLNELLDEIK